MWCHETCGGGASAGNDFEDNALATENAKDTGNAEEKVGYKIVEEVTYDEVFKDYSVPSKMLKKVIKDSANTAFQDVQCPSLCHRSSCLPRTRGGDPTARSR